MGLLFRNDLHDEFGLWPAAYIPYGGADWGEIAAVGRAVGDGDDSAYYAAWAEAADKLFAQADEAAARGRRISAREAYLRASAFYSASFHPLYGSPVDRRLLVAFRKQIDAFDKGLALSDTPVEPLSIPFENENMPGYLIPAVGLEGQVRPLIVFTNGYDATVTDLYFASALAASRRGYHSLIFDGPGQGAMLYDKGIHLRPDWETVVGAVIDFAVGLPCVDPKRIALSGGSLGGHLAPRAASGEHRLAACIADPAQWDIAGSFRGVAVKFGASRQAAANLGDLDQSILDRLWSAVQSDARLRWKIVQRGFWVHGVDNLRDYLLSAEQFTMNGRADSITCPMLLTAAENDPLAAKAAEFYEKLNCPKTLIHFSAAEGAGDHCEMGNRSLFNRRSLDWLDDVFERAGYG